LPKRDRKARGEWRPAGADANAPPAAADANSPPTPRTSIVWQQESDMTDVRV